MDSRRVTVPLGALLADLIDHRGQTPKKLGTDFCGVGIRVVSAKNIKGSRIDMDKNVRFVNDATFARWMPTRLSAGDVLMTSEAPLGEVAYLDHSDDLVLGQRLFALRADERRLHGRYLFYLLQGPEAQAAIHARATGTTAQGIRQSELLKAELEIPEDVDEQRAIAAFLGALDDKIELNRRMGRTLDEMSQAVFKSWFVDSDDEPSEGRLGDVVDVVRVPIQPQDAEPSTPYVGLEHFDGGSTTLRRWGFAPDASSGKSAFQRGDILFGKLRPYFHNVAVAPFAGVCSTDVMVLRPKAPEMFGFALGHINSDEFIDFTMARSEGTRMPRTKRSDVVGYPIQMPPHSRLVAFGQVVVPVFERQRTLTLQARDLEQLRDALLPRLLSGEIRIHEPETATEGAS